MNLHITIELEQTGIWRGSPSQRKSSRPKGEPAIITRPVRLKTATGELLAHASALPLRDAAVTSIACREVLEFVRNDTGLIDEIARVLAPGGMFRLSVPTTGPLAGLDRFNLMHYVVDFTHRGARPRETQEVGWRRHYRVDDIAEMLGASRFKIVAIERRRLAVAEIAGFAAMFLFRWLKPSHQRYRAAMKIASIIERAEDNLRTPFGSVLTIRATRLPDNSR